MLLTVTRAKQHIEHEIAPVFDEHSRVLMLGTFPSPKSREQGFFYGHPQNRFWKVLADVANAEVPQTIPEKKELLLKEGIALWDVCQSCQTEGASDASIRDPKPNDLRLILDTAPIQQIFCTGAKATQLYRKLIEPQLGISCVQLPSTSPANAAMRLPALVNAYREALLPYLTD